MLSCNFVSNWELKGDLEILSLAMNCYATYLDEKNEDQQKRQKLDHPPRQVGEHAWMEVKPGCEVVNPKYSLLDTAIGNLQFHQYLFFDEERHLTGPFLSANDKYHFFDRLSLSVSICMLNYCPGGAFGKIVYLWKVPDHMETSDIIKNSLFIYERLKPCLPEFHKRQMRREFISRNFKISNTCVPKHILRAVYAELTLDFTAMQNPAVDTRVQQAILSEDPDLMIDLRHANPGRPNDTFNEFFEKLNSKVRDFQTVDDRRQGAICHFSKYISVPDLIRDVTEELPENTPVPSESTVLFSFVPKNAYAKTAKLYTSRVPLQHKVQSRQLRTSHVDEHYCSALFRYAREYAIRYRDETTFICVDDKCKIDFGEPGQYM